MTSNSLLLKQFQDLRWVDNYLIASAARCLPLVIGIPPVAVVTSLTTRLAISTPPVFIIVTWLLSARSRSIIRSLQTPDNYNFISGFPFSALCNGIHTFLNALVTTSAVLWWPRNCCYYCYYCQVFRLRPDILHMKNMSKTPKIMSVITVSIELHPKF